MSSQTFKDFEVIFVDNKSTDNSLSLLGEILQDEANRNLNVKTIKMKKNFGYCMGNNVGLKHANGEYVVFLNNDTYVASTWLAELVDVIIGDPSIGACQSRHIQPQTGTVHNDGWYLDRYCWTQRIILHPLDQKMSKVPFYVSGSCMIMRKADLDKLSGFDGELFFGDFDICWRLRLMGYEIAVAFNSLCFHFGSVATDMLHPKVNTFYFHCREMLRVLLKNYSTINVVRRIPVALVLMVGQTAYWTFKCRTPLFSMNLLKALIWNLQKFRDTFSCRLEIQNSRIPSDDKIDSSMLNYSVILTRSNLRNH